MFERINNFLDLSEKFISLLKFAGYIILAIFIYSDFVLNGMAKVSTADESIKSVAISLFTDRIIYTSISLAILEAIGNLIVVLKKR